MTRAIVCGVGWTESDFRSVTGYTSARVVRSLNDGTWPRIAEHISLELGTADVALGAAIAVMLQHAAGRRLARKAA